MRQVSPGKLLPGKLVRRQLAFSTINLGVLPSMSREAAPVHVGAEGRGWGDGGTPKTGDGIY